MIEGLLIILIAVVVYFGHNILKELRSKND